MTQNVFRTLAIVRETKATEDFFTQKLAAQLAFR